MRTVILNKPGQLQAMDTPEPGAPAGGNALVRVHRVGVCGTDIHAFGGRQPFFNYPRILGHELGVEILQVGANDRGLNVRDFCAVEPYLNCGQCIACRRGKPNCCVAMSVLGVHQDGGMREFIQVPVDKLHRSSKLTQEQLALVETLVIGCHAVERAALEPGENVLVLGSGPIGLSVIQFAQAAGARVIVGDINAGRLEFCRSQLRVETTIDVSKPGMLDGLREITAGDLPTAVFDATGNADSMMAAFEYPAHGGRLVFVGLFPGEVRFADPNFHRRELTLLATRNGLPQDFRQVIRLVESGAIDTRPWITHRAQLEAVPEQFPNWIRPESGVIKAIVEVS